MGGGLRPEHPEEHKAGVDDSECVDGNTPTAERVGVGKTAVQDTANTDDVGDHQRSKVERDDGVESSIRPDVDE